MTSMLTPVPFLYTMQGREAASPMWSDDGESNRGGSVVSSVRSTKQSLPVFDLLRAFPVVAIIFLSALLYFVFVMFHILPMIQRSTPYMESDRGFRFRGIYQCIIFHILFLMFVANYILTIITPAGEIPHTPEWRATATHLASAMTSASPTSRPAFPRTAHSESEAKEQKKRRPSIRLPPLPVELKQSGDTRCCKWCRVIKPDRAHHCRICRKCVLRMDHHCPWVYNCIGYENHKYFFLLVLYATATLLFASITQLETVARAIDEPLVPSGSLFLLLFAESLGILLLVISTAFLFFHIWLVSHEMSTIEFCEKNFRRGGQDVYDLGWSQNLYTTFGDNILLWCLPIDNRSGNGLTYRVRPKKTNLDREESHSSGRQRDPLLETQPLLSEVNDNTTEFIDTGALPTPPTPYEQNETTFVNE